MNATLTLSLEDKVFAQVENYVQEQEIPLSKLIENYLISLVSIKKSKRKTINPIVEELTGIIPDMETDNYKKEYQDYLTKKYS
jgi:Holliday junction resolvase RusA-like endonuclease